MVGDQVLRKIGIVVRRKLGPTGFKNTEGLAYWRQRIFHYFSQALVFIGSLVYVYFSWICITANHFEQFLFCSFVYASALFVSVVKSLPLKFRISWVLFSIYLIGIFSLIQYKSTSLGFAFLLSFSLLSAILIGQRAAIRSVFINIATLGFIGVLMFVPQHFVPAITPLGTLFEYSNLAVGFLVVSLISLSPLISLVNGLVFTIKKEKRYRKLLREEHLYLIDAKKKAEESDRLKTAFLSNMSHEIRTPMNAILGFSNLLTNRQIADDEKREFINLIQSNGKSLMTLVEDIIDISKIESGQLQIKNGPCHLHGILDEVYQSYNDDLKRRNLFHLKLYLKEGFDDDNVMILTDSHRLKQILINLVGNAIKFTEKGYVEFGYQQQDQYFIQFYVKDTGIGLPEGKENEIFDRFSKFTDNTQRLYGGTGIGLSIAKQLCDLMGGQIWVKSEPLIGTTFYFTLPFHKIGVKSPKPMFNLTHKGFNWEGKTFLVAEDEEDNFRYIEVALALSNVSLIWARDGKEAVDIFRKVDNIDLVLMDLKMPIMDGYKATREIKKMSRTVPIIAQTAYAMIDEQERSFEAGCDDYIAKPIGYEELLGKINKFMPGTSEPAHEIYSSRL